MARRVQLASRWPILPPRILPRAVRTRTNRLWFGARKTLFLSMVGVLAALLVLWAAYLILSGFPTTLGHKFLKFPNMTGNTTSHCRSYPEGRMLLPRAVQLL
jgi:hypothetical protein